MIFSYKEGQRIFWNGERWMFLKRFPLCRLFLYKFRNRLRNVFRFKEIFNASKTQKQSCKRCGNETYYDFHVDDDLWNKATPEKYKKTSLCINCFIKLAQREIKSNDFKKIFIVK